MEAPRVLILVGSDSDLLVMEQAGAALEELGLGWQIHIASAHRSPDHAIALARSAREEGFSAIIAGAGLAAHLPGVIAACTTLPVIGVPLRSGALAGTDSLHAIVQMPRGIPVATVAIDGAWNAGLLAAQIVGVADEQVAERLATYKQQLAENVLEKDRRLQTGGIDAFRRQVAAT